MTHTADAQLIHTHTAPHGAATAGRGGDAALYLVAIVLAALVLAVSVWGLVALTLTALALVPVMLTLLIAIGWPRN